MTLFARLVSLQIVSREVLAYGPRSQEAGGVGWGWRARSGGGGRAIPNATLSPPEGSSFPMPNGERYFNVSLTVKVKGAGQRPLTGNT